MDLVLLFMQDKVYPTVAEVISLFISHITESSFFTILIILMIT